MPSTSDLTDLERPLRDRLDALGPAPRGLTPVPGPPTMRVERVGRICEFYGNPRTRTFAELLIDLEESPHARGVVLGELRERQLRGES